MKNLVCLLICLFVSSAHATIIKNVSGIDNLEWLELSDTRDLTRNEVLTLITSDNTYADYRYASISEVELLLNSYPGVSSLSNPAGWENAMGQDSAAFFAEFGLFEDNGSYLRTSYMFGADGECGVNISCGGFVHGNRNSSGVIDRGYYYGNYGWDVTTPVFVSGYDDQHWSGGWGSLLVRETTAVTEPSSLALFSLVIAGIGISRKKKTA